MDFSISSITSETGASCCTLLAISSAVWIILSYVDVQFAAEVEDQLETAVPLYQVLAPVLGPVLLEVVSRRTALSVHRREVVEL